MQDPEAEDHIEALTGVHERQRVAVLHTRAQQLGDRTEALAAFELDPQRALTQATYCSLSTATTRATPGV